MRTGVLAGELAHRRASGAHLALGFTILAAESDFAAVYFALSPHGPHRTVLLVVSCLAAALGAFGVHLSPWAGEQPWCDRFELGWSIAVIAVVGVSAYLDGGLESPLLYLFAFPVVHASTKLRPRLVATVGAATLAAAFTVGLTDPDITTPQESITMLAAFIVGVTVLAITSAVHRARLESAQAALVEELDERAAVDGLTGCWNYRAFHERLADEVDRARRYNHPVSLMVCDVDLFKGYNDTYGHAEGDAALARLGGYLRSAARSSDIVGRIGGDEFAVLLPETPLAAARVLAEAMVRDNTRESGTRVSFSIGVAGLNPAEPTPKRLFRDADSALYDAKGTRRGTVASAGPVGEVHPGPGDRVLQRADVTRAEEVTRMAQREQLETEMILELLLQEAPVGFAFIDRDFRVLRMNQVLAGRRSVQCKHPIGRHMSEVVPDLWPTLEPLYDQVLREGAPVRNLEVGMDADDAPEDAALVNLYPVRVAGITMGVGAIVVPIAERKRLEQSQVSLTKAVVNVLGATVEARDPYTAGHQRRVGEIATAIAKELGFDASIVQGIGLAAAIHDIGKVAVPAEILSRPGGLSNIEMEMVRQHAEAGFNILRDIEFPWPVADMVLQHHERLDGSGYPRGLHADEIGIGARIIAVADVVEAMAASRPYRPALGTDAALAAIEEGRDSQFDPAVVDVCIRLLRPNGQEEAEALAARPQRRPSERPSAADIIGAHRPSDSCADEGQSEAPGRRRRALGTRGAALVELAIALPVLFALLLGITTAGLSYSRKISVDAAARDAARYGATLPVSNYSGLAGSAGWLAAVAAQAQQSGVNDLATSVPGLSICVAYVYPNGTATTDSNAVLVRTGSGDTYSTGTNATCFADGLAASMRRVQVLVRRQSSIEAVVFSTTVSLSAQGLARFEAS